MTGSTYTDIKGRMFGFHNPGRETDRTAGGGGQLCTTVYNSSFRNIHHPCQSQGPVMDTRNTRDFFQTIMSMPMALRLPMYQVPMALIQCSFKPQPVLFIPQTTNLLLAPHVFFQGRQER